MKGLQLEINVVTLYAKSIKAWKAIDTATVLPPQEW